MKQTTESVGGPRGDGDLTVSRVAREEELTRHDGEAPVVDQLRLQTIMWYGMGWLVVYRPCVRKNERRSSTRIIPNPTVACGNRHSSSSSA